jgi:hypothetical protein
MIQQLGDFFLTQRTSENLRGALRISVVLCGSLCNSV